MIESVMAPWPWPLTYDLDLLTWPRYLLTWPPCQNASPYINPFGFYSETDRRTDTRCENYYTRQASETWGVKMWREHQWPIEESSTAFWGKILEFLVAFKGIRSVSRQLWSDWMSWSTGICFWIKWQCFGILSRSRLFMRPGERESPAPGLSWPKKVT